MTGRVTEHRHSLPSEVAESLTLKILKIHLDMALSKQFYMALFEQEVGPDEM